MRQRILWWVAHVGIALFEWASNRLPPVPHSPLVSDHDDSEIRVYVGRRRVMPWEPLPPGLSDWPARMRRND